MKINWKVISIILLVIFVIENSFIIYSVTLVNKESKDTLVCYYETCKGYPEATFIDNLCTCYEKDVLGNLNPSNFKVFNAHVVKKNSVKL